MTSRIELRKQQQRQVTAGTSSVGWVAGEAVVATVGRRTDLMPPQQELAVVDDGFSIRAYREDYIPEAVDPTTTTTTTTGLTIGPRNPKQYWKNVGLETDPTFMEFTSDSDISEVYVSLETGTRPTITATITVISPTEYEISSGDILAVWTTPSERISSDDARVIGRYRSWGESAKAANALEKLNPDTGFGSLVDTYNLDLHRRSTRNKETKGNSLYTEGLNGAENTISLASFYHDSRDTFDGEYYNVYIFSRGDYLVQDGETTGRHIGASFNTQISGWQPANVERRTGTPPFTGKGRLIAPVDMAVQFIDAGGSVIETKTVTIPDTTTELQHLHVTRTSTTATPTIKVTVGKDGEHNAWLRSFTVPLPRRFSNAATDTYIISRTDNDEDDLSIQLLGHAKAINVPSIATLAGTRPNEYLTYSGAWDGSTFQALRCRCPAWILYHVLTDERWGIELPAARIGAASFLEASQYCQALVGSGPRWVFDGTLQGTQNEVIANLLRLMRGWLYTDVSGRYQLTVERPQASQWLICPAVTSGGRISYRSALPRPAVRCTFTDRLTGRAAVTTGLDTARVETVPWQDPEVAQRWADWETFSEQRLLDTVEFTLPWAYHAVAPGDLISVHDPSHAGIRLAGRIVTATSGWLQLDSTPLELWPDLTASAPLLQRNGRAALDSDLWGYTVITVPSNSDGTQPAVALQTPGGGIVEHPISRIAWLPGGRPDQNRVYLTTALDSTPADRTPWALHQVGVPPTHWRVQSVTEGAEGREFAVVATRWIPGMHAHIETGAALPTATTQWAPECGTALSRFRGLWDDINERYPKAGAGPFDSPGEFDDLATSCVS